MVIRSAAFRSTFARMPNIGPLELGILLLIVLIIFGPKRLPGLGRQLGSGMREFKDSITGKDKDKDDDDDDERDAVATPAQRPSRAEIDPTAAEPEVVTGEARREDQPASRADS
jgi:sec-independent protein translocase protein TatA